MEVEVSERAVLVDSEANVEADVLGLVSLADFRIVIVIIVKVVAGNRPHVECGTLGQGFINILKYIYKPLLLGSIRGKLQDSNAAIYRGHGIEPCFVFIHLIRSQCWQ